MLRSLYSGVSGLRSHQIKMDVIGNNIANVNTTAFKASRVTFKDVYYQTISNATGNTQTRGGTNPKQIGYGSTVASIDVLNSRGGYQTTDRPLDLYIAGDGYFVMKDRSGQTNYTRSGNFNFDTQGALVDTNGNYVSGWQPAYQSGGAAGPITINNIDNYSDIQIGKDGIITGAYAGPNPPRMPNTFEEVSNLSDIKVAGYSNIRFKDGVLIGDGIAPPTTDVELYNNIKINADGTITGDDMVGGTTGVVIEQLKNITAEPSDFSKWQIETDGTISGLFAGHFKNTIEEFGSINGPSLKIAGYDNVTYANGKITGEDSVTGTVTTLYTKVTIDPATGTFKGDNALTSTVGETIAALNIGNLVTNKSLYTKFKLEADGKVSAEYISASNPDKFPGKIEVLGQIALAKFSNPEGLSQQDGIYFAETGNSGAPIITYPGNNGTAPIVSYGLEMSNVDLSKEFTDMITTQRGFQANSRVITTSDEMLQELVNLKR